MGHPYALVKKVATSYEATIEGTKKALADQGFGILSEIEVHAALKKRLGVEYPRTLILGACNPTFAHRTLQAEPNISVFLPCNVVVRETASGDVEVAMIDPAAMALVIENPEVEVVAKEVDQRLRAALAAL